MPTVPGAWMMAAAGALAIATAGCNIGLKYSVGGTVSGLTGQGLVLEVNSGNDLRVSSDGAFTFTAGIRNTHSYSVTVKTQPSNPSQTCTVRNGSGTIDKADVTNVVVTCTQAGHFAYVANQLSNNLSAYSIDAATGTLAPVNGSPLPGSRPAPLGPGARPAGELPPPLDHSSNSTFRF